jgi:hypothetical protein
MDLTQLSPLVMGVITAVTAAVAWILWKLGFNAKHETAIVSELWIYPIKSCRGVQVRHAEIDSRGFKYDRNFMIVTGPKVRFPHKLYRIFLRIT